MFGLFIDPSDAQIERISLGIKRSLETPIVGDIQGFVWEKIFAYGHDILDMRPSKKLFDVVTADGRGWSCKTIESNAHEIGCRVEYVIARSDIYSKGVELGFRGGLTENSPPQVLGEALIKHFNQKFQEDRSGQNVHAPHVAVLVKSTNRQRFTYVEATYPEWDPSGIEWSWNPPRGNRAHVGLTGSKDGEPVLRWHPSGTQLFEILTLPMEARTFTVKWQAQNLKSFFEGG